MPVQETRPCWLDRITQIPSEVDEIRLPSLGQDDVPQDRDWCEVIVAGDARRVRLHDYDKIYEVPGLYEELFYGRLNCCSPSRVARLLDDVIRDFEDDPADLKVLDVGAGNGMVGDELQALGVRKIVGIDIIEEAKEAAQRDRPEVYDEYLVTDLTNLPEWTEERLRREAFNCLSTVAALGFGDIPPKAFLKAMDVVATPGWLAFNIKEAFLSERDPTGFCRLVRQLSREEIIQVQAYRRYQHRVSIVGKPLYYVAMVARKLRDIPDHLMES
jgi:predicted TPR repeat methyltransferase